MKIAVHASGELAVRTGRVLLAEPEVHVGLFGEDSKAKRVHRVDALADWDALIVDEISIGSRVHIERAFGLGIPVVLAEDKASFDAAEVTLVTGALDGARLAMALAESGLGAADAVMEAQLAWTVPGHPLGEGAPVTFPDPVGPLWADSGSVPNADYPVRGLAAPLNAPWRAVAARLTHGTDDGITQNVVGIADDRNFFDAAVLGAVAMAAAEGAYPAGINGPGDPDGTFLRNAERAGLHIAAFTAA